MGIDETSRRDLSRGIDEEKNGFHGYSGYLMYVNWIFHG